MGTSSAVYETERAESVAAHIAAALAASAERSHADERWSGCWDAIGPAQPHDPVNNTVWSGINRYALAAGRTAIGGAPTGAWATEESWQGAGRALRAGEPGIVTLHAGLGGLRAVTVYNACQLAEPAAPDERFAAPPPLEAADIDRLFAGGGVASTEEDPERRASQLAEVAVAQTGAALGRPAGWQDARESLVGVLASQVAVNALGFAYWPDRPAPDVVEEWSELLRGPDGGGAALAATADAARLAASVVEQIAAHQLEAPHQGAAALDAGYPHPFID
ncbi:hypothetical protein [Candidatus Poriferisocius sp.]|uniref:hypothetical protein n=1 Tax=Candidatus Poriferisocius sp. TaxID=3101276 RepID=UPI003B517BBB